MCRDNDHGSHTGFPNWGWNLAASTSRFHPGHGQRARAPFGYMGLSASRQLQSSRCKPLPAQRPCNLRREGDPLTRGQSPRQRTASPGQKDCHFGVCRSRLAGGYFGFPEVIWVTSPQGVRLQCSRKDRKFQDRGWLPHWKPPLPGFACGRAEGLWLMR